MDAPATREHRPDAWATWCSTARRSVAGPARPSTTRWDSTTAPAIPGTHSWWCTTAGDYLHYASLAAVLDNLIADGRLPPLVARAADPDERLVEYADDPRHHAYLTRELVPRLERELPLVATPAARCLMGASFGAVAALSAAYAAPGTFGRLLAAVRLVRRRRHRLPAARRRRCRSR